MSDKINGFNELGDSLEEDGGLPLGEPDFGGLDLGAFENPEQLISILVTLVLGGYVGLKGIVDGLRNYSEGNFPSAGRNMLKGNLGLLSGAVINELVKKGALGAYTLAEIPFLVAGLKEYFTHARPTVAHVVARVARKVNTAAMLAINVVFHGVAALNGNITTANDVLRHLGFAGLSTSFTMPFDRERRVGSLNMAQWRVATNFMTRSMLLAALGPRLGESIVDAALTYNLNELDLLAVIWFSLNSYGLRGDLRNIGVEFGPEHCDDDKVGTLRRVFGRRDGGE